MIFGRSIPEDVPLNNCDPTPISPQADGFTVVPRASPWKVRSGIATFRLTMTFLVGRLNVPQGGRAVKQIELPLGHYEAAPVCR